MHAVEKRQIAAMDSQAPRKKKGYICINKIAPWLRFGWTDSMFVKEKDTKIGTRKGYMNQNGSTEIHLRS